MPRLLLLRHAKAERARPGESDHDRALAERGREDCATMGRVLAERAHGIDRVLCSSSRRTRQTWELVKAALSDPPKPSFMHEIYQASDYLPILRAEGGEAAALLLVGHNPTMLDAAAQLAREGNPEIGGRFPTAALAVIDFDGTWDALAPGAGRLVAFLRPRGVDAE